MQSTRGTAITKAAKEIEAALTREPLAKGVFGRVFA